MTAAPSSSRKTPIGVSSTVAVPRIAGLPVFGAEFLVAEDRLETEPVEDGRHGSRIGDFQLQFFPALVPAGRRSALDVRVKILPAWRTREELSRAAQLQASRVEDGISFQHAPPEDAKARPSKQFLGSPDIPLPPA